MAAVAGAIAEQVGRGLLAQLGGGDRRKRRGRLSPRPPSAATVAVFAGDVAAQPADRRPHRRRRSDPLAVCTSSGTVGHSLELRPGRCRLRRSSRSCALADAAATAIGNRVQRQAGHPQRNRARQGASPVFAGVVIVVADQMGVWGEVEVVAVRSKKGLSFQTQTD
ncbi:MAG: hypothetical protein MZV70_29020 [Desulfobacterales bacterium]|nr:hypothetical protein [Desulfobacterales bacterium]